MPQLQVVNTTRDKPEPTRLEQFFSKMGKDYRDKQDRVEIGSLLKEYETNKSDEDAFEKLQLGLMKSTVSPSRRIEAQKELNDIQKGIIENKKALNSKVNKQMLSVEEKEEQYNDLIEDGYPPEEAKIYMNSPPGVKQSLERNHRMEKARGMRKAPQQQTKENAPVNEGEISQPVAEGESISEEVPVKEQWPDLPAPEQMIPAERVKWENNNEKTNIKELKEIEKKKKAYRDNGILIRSMSKVNDSQQLPSGLGKMVLVDPESGDIRPIAQLADKINPETQLYIKNLKQFLKGAKDFFGARVTNFDVSSFMQQLPSLLNSEQGRRVILKQMELVNDLEAIHANELDEGLKHYGRKANYLDISRTVDEKVSQKESQLLNKIDQVVEASKELDKMAKNPDKFRDYSLMQTNEGKFKAVKKDLISKYESQGWSTY